MEGVESEERPEERSGERPPGAGYTIQDYPTLTAGKVTEFPLPSGAQPEDIVDGPAFGSSLRQWKGPGKYQFRSQLVDEQNGTSSGFSPAGKISLH